MFLKIILIFITICFFYFQIIIYADDKNDCNYKPEKAFISPFNIVASPSEVLAYPVNTVSYKSIIIFCLEKKSLENEPENYSCNICFFYGGTKDGIEKKYRYLANTFQSTDFKNINKNLWIVKNETKDNIEKYALIYEPGNMQKKGVFQLAKEMALQLKKQTGQNDPVNLNQIATPTCNGFLNNVYKYKPILNNKPLPLKMDNDEIKNLLQQANNSVSETIKNNNISEKELVISVYNKNEKNISTFIIPVQANVYKDSETNIIFVKHSGIGLGTKYYVGYSPYYKNNFSEKYAILSIGFPIISSDNNFFHAINIPYSDEINTKQMLQYGRNYLVNKIENVFQGIKENPFPSMGFRGKTIIEILPDNMKLLLMTLTIIEHMDHGKYIPFLDIISIGHNKILKGIKKEYKKKITQIMYHQLYKVLINLASNEENAFKYSVSKSNATGLAQIIKPTYDSLIELYPKANIEPDYFKGAMDHYNGILAQILHIDSEIATLRKSKSINNLFEDYNKFNQSNIFDIIIAGYNFSAPKLKKIISKNNDEINKKWKKQIPFETQLYIFKAKFVKNVILQ